MGEATAPNVTVVATPLPEGPPRRKEARVTVRPALVGFPPIAAKEKSIKNLPDPENSKKAPQMVKRMMKVEETSIGTPKIPSRVIYIWPTMRSISYPRSVQGLGSRCP